MPYEARYNAINAIKGEGIKISTPKQMLQILTIAHAQVKEGNTLKNLLNKIRQIVYSLYLAKEITKKVYSNIIKSILTQISQNRFMDLENSKTYNLHMLLLNLTDKMDLQRGEKRLHFKS